MPSCVLQLRNFNVNQLHFYENSKYSEDESLTIRPKFSIEAFQAEDNPNFYKIVLGCRIFEEISAPFKISVEVEGEFSVEGENCESMIQYNAVAILMPYVRALVTQLTCLAEKPPLFFPIINIYSLIDGEKSENYNDENENSGQKIDDNDSNENEE